jgi:hypothetical protein
MAWMIANVTGILAYVPAKCEMVEMTYVLQMGSFQSNELGICRGDPLL